MICEKCWSEAETRGMESKTDAYRTILKERRDHPCTPPEQAGGWWDEENQRDLTRLTLPAPPYRSMHRHDLPRLPRRASPCLNWPNRNLPAMPGLNRH